MEFKLNSAMLKKLTGNELEEFFLMIQEERCYRRNEERAKAWAQVVSVIKDYCKKYEDICIYGDTFINEDSNYIEPGEIN